MSERKEFRLRLPEPRWLWPLPSEPTAARGVPYCDDSCPLHDGKRCEATGMQPGNICEPSVVNMARHLDRAAKIAARIGCANDGKCDVTSCVSCSLLAAVRT